MKKKYFERCNNTLLVFSFLLWNLLTIRKIQYNDGLTREVQCTEQLGIHMDVYLSVTVVSIIQFTLSFFNICLTLFQAQTAEVKTTWVNEIRKVLTTQLEACRGTERGCSLKSITKCHVNTDIHV